MAYAETKWMPEHFIGGHPALDLANPCKSLALTSAHQSCCDYSQSVFAACLLGNAAQCWDKTITVGLGELGVGRHPLVQRTALVEKRIDGRCRPDDFDRSDIDVVKSGGCHLRPKRFR